MISTPTIPQATEVKQKNAVYVPQPAEHPDATDFQIGSDYCMDIVGILVRQNYKLSQQAETASGEQRAYLLKQISKNEKHMDAYEKEGIEVISGDVEAYKRTILYHTGYLDKLEKKHTRRYRYGQKNKGPEPTI
ncbi:MAG: hypothetical protein WC521_08230 [Bdellovibrionales bacterium]